MQYEVSTEYRAGHAVQLESILRSYLSSFVDSYARCRRAWWHRVLDRHVRHDVCWWLGNVSAAEGVDWSVVITIVASVHTVETG